MRDRESPLVRFTSPELLPNEILLSIEDLIDVVLTDDHPVVRAGLRDVLVEPRRAPLIAGFDAVKRAALEAGALGASISGAGPSVFAWFESRGEAEAATPSVQAAFASAGFDSQAWVSPINATGAELLSAT